MINRVALFSLVAIGSAVALNSQISMAASPSLSAQGPQAGNQSRVDLEKSGSRTKKDENGSSKTGITGLISVKDKAGQIRYFTVSTDFAKLSKAAQAELIAKLQKGKSDVQIANLSQDKLSNLKGLQSGYYRGWAPGPSRPNFCYYNRPAQQFCHFNVVPQYYVPYNNCQVNYYPAYNCAPIYQYQPYQQQSQTTYYRKEVREFEEYSSSSNNSGGGYYNGGYNPGYNPGYGPMPYYNNQSNNQWNRGNNWDTGSSSQSSSGGYNPNW